jgi:hypothetical protein
MSNTLKFGAGKWAAKAGSVLAYNDENNNFKPLPFTFTRASTATRVNDSGLIESVASGVPRIDFLDNADGHLLLEPSRTNIVPYSEAFDNAAWSKIALGIGSTPVVTANQGLSPDGTMTADRIVLDLNGGVSSDDSSFLSEVVTVSSGATVSLTIYLKSNTGLTQNLIMWEAFTGEAISCVVTNEWQRFNVIATAPSTSSGFRFGLRNAFGVTVDDTADILAWGAQAEEGSYATSYIPTSGSSVTRAADANYKNSDEGNIIDSAKIIYVEFDELGVNRAQRRNIFELKSSSGNEIYARTESSGTLTIQVITGSVSQALFQSIAYNTTANNKIGIAFDTNDVVVYLNGTQVASDTSVSIPVLNSAYLGTNIAATQQYAGGIKEARLYDTRLSNSELAALTSL